MGESSPKKDCSFLVILNKSKIRHPTVYITSNILHLTDNINPLSIKKQTGYLLKLMADKTVEYKIFKLTFLKLLNNFIGEILKIGRDFYFSSVSRRIQSDVNSCHPSSCFKTKIAGIDFFKSGKRIISL